MPDELTCKEFVELVTAYLDGALNADETARFDEHLADCSGCAAYLDQFRATVGMLGQLPVDTLSTDAQAMLLSAFRTWKQGSQP